MEAARRSIRPRSGGGAPQSALPHRLPAGGAQVGPAAARRRRRLPAVLRAAAGAAAGGGGVARRRRRRRDRDGPRPALVQRRQLRQSVPLPGPVPVATHPPARLLVRPAQTHRPPGADGRRGRRRRRLCQA